MLTPALNLDSVVAGYGDRQVLHNVSLDLSAGSFMALVGPNGSGKSTLFSAITGLLPCSAGTVTLDKEPVQAMARNRVAQFIALLPQRSQIIFPFSVLQVVLMGRHPYSGFTAVDSISDVQIARESLDKLKIGHLAERPFTQLSGGEQQLVLMARVVAQQTPIILLDEPLAGLDLRHQLAILDLAREYSAAGKSVLCSFHDLSLARKWCSSAVVLNNGTIAATGAPEAVLVPEVLSPVFQVKIHLSNSEHLTF